MNDHQQKILYALRSGEELSGLEIRSRVNAAYDAVETFSNLPRQKRINIGSLYVNLKALKERGLIESRPGEAPKERGGCRRWYYCITDAGLQALETSGTEPNYRRRTLIVFGAVALVIAAGFASAL